MSQKRTESICGLCRRLYLRSNQTSQKKTTLKLRGAHSILWNLTCPCMNSTDSRSAIGLYIYTVQPL